MRVRVSGIMNGNQPDARNLKQSGKWLKLKIEQKRWLNNRKKERCVRVDNLFQTDRSEFWKFVRRSKNRKTKIDSFKMDFCKYYSDLYSSEISTHPFHVGVESIVRDKFVSLLGKDLPTSLTSSDVRKAMECLSLGKSIGYDRICAEMFRFASETSLVVVVTWLIRGMWITGHIPANFNNALITPILKSGKIPNEPADFRPISVFTPLAAFFEEVIRRNICLEMHPNQFGFKPRTSTKLMRHYNIIKKVSLLVGLQVSTPLKLSISFGETDYFAIVRYYCARGR